MSEFFKSSYSTGNGACLETRLNPTTVDVRDSKDISIPGIEVGSEAFAAFTGAIALGELGADIIQA